MDTLMLRNAKISKGSIEQLEKNKPKSRCTKWRLQVYVDGIKKNKRYEGSYTNAQHALERWKNELLDDSSTIRYNITFGDYSALWLEQKRKSDIKESSYQSTSWRIAALNYFFKDVLLSDITEANVNDFLWQMKQGNTLTNRKYRSSYRYDLFVRLNLILEKAVKEGYILKNPCENVIPPKVVQPTKEALTKEQLNNLLSMLDFKDPIQAGVGLCASMGLRRAEAAALTFGDVGESSLKIKSAKTKAGVRVLPLSEKAKEIISTRRATQAEILQVTAETPICGVDVAPDPHSLTKWWERNRKRLGFSSFTLHELRHSYLTLLAEAGVDARTMQELAGHSSPITTLKIYTHVHDEHKFAAQEQLDKYLNS